MSADAGEGNVGIDARAAVDALLQQVPQRFIRNADVRGGLGGGRARFHGVNAALPPDWVVRSFVHATLFHGDETDRNHQVSKVPHLPRASRRRLGHKAFENKY